MMMMWDYGSSSVDLTMNILDSIPQGLADFRLDSCGHFLPIRLFLGGMFIVEHKSHSLPVGSGL